MTSKNFVNKGPTSKLTEFFSQYDGMISQETYMYSQEMDNQLSYNLLAEIQVQVAVVDPDLQIRKGGEGLKICFWSKNKGEPQAPPPPPPPLDPLLHSFPSWASTF